MDLNLQRHWTARMLSALLVATGIAPAIAAAPSWPVSWFGAVFALPKVDQQIQLRVQLAQPLGKGFDVPVGGGATLKVASCNDLFAADARGLHMTGTAHVAYRYFALSCYAARAIAQARASSTSYLRDFKLDEATVKKLPAALWTRFANAKTASTHAPSARLGDMAGNARYSVTDTPDSKQVVVTDSHGNTQDIAWVARGDFNRDGTEDLLLATHDSAAASGAEGFQLVVLSRQSANAPLAIIQRIAVNGPQSR